MKTITACKTRSGHYGFTDPASEHDFIIFGDGEHAINEEGEIWQVVEELEDEENVGYLTYEDSRSEYIFNYAEDGGAIDWMRGHYIYVPDSIPDGVILSDDETDYFDDIDWDLVKNEMDNEDIFNLMKECENEGAFHDILSKKYGYDEDEN